MSIEELIAKKYPPRPIRDTDIQPQLIDPFLSGPFFVGKHFIICEHCSSIIRANYAIQHKNSGACDRNLQRSQKDASY
jgi:phage terminase large subunit GpA-like protein